MVALVAPSFTIDFEYPQIVGMLKKAGFEKVVEVARGAEETNRQLLEYLQKNPKTRTITNPCPALVRMVRTQYPDLVKYLSPIHSPMINSARLAKKEFPNLMPVFVGPCPVKKLEAAQDYPKENISVLTYQELQSLFDHLKITPNPDETQYFDLAHKPTRLYPISGGLAQSAGLIDLLADEEYDVVSGLENIQKSLERFRHDPKLRLLDILFCDGGCVAGKGIINCQPLQLRREKVISHWAG